MREVFGFQHLWHWFVLKVDDDAEAESWLDPLTDQPHGFAAELRTEFTVRQRPDETFEVSDGPDVLAASVQRSEVLDLIVQRMSCHALELASRKGWLCFRGVVSREGGRSALSFSASPGVTAPDGMFVAKDGVVMEVPRLHPIRPDVGAIPVGPLGVVGWEDVVAVLRVEAADEVRIEPISSLETVRALLTQAVELTERPAERIKAATTLARHAPGFAVWAPSWPLLPTQVWECL